MAQRAWVLDMDMYMDGNRRRAWLRVVCAAPPAVVFVVTSLCKKQSERVRENETTTTMGTFHMTFLGFALCVATQLRRAQKTPDCIWAAQRAVALRWDGRIEEKNSSCTILMGIISKKKKKTRSTKLKLCWNKRFSVFPWLPRASSLEQDIIHPSTTIVF